MFKIPTYYKELPPVPEDPPKSKVYGCSFKESQSFMSIFPISNNKLMSFDKNEVIYGVHECLDNDQGMIECKEGFTSSGIRYIYTIIKSKLEPSGVQYFLRMHLKDNDSAYEINIFSQEMGMTGYRDATIFGILGMKDFSKWVKDPYIDNYKKGLLMNLSEDKKYDEMFPNHPLSVLRETIHYIINNN